MTNRRLACAFALVLTAACAHAPASKTAGRMPDRDKVLQVAQAKWGDQLVQVPSVVIEKGPLAVVPYYSYRAGDFEVNVYGDPAAPACVEVGTYKDDEESRKVVGDLLDKMMPSAADSMLSHGMNPAGDRKERDGMTVEVTPPSAPDAFGGWWLSYYDLDALAVARAEVFEAISEATSEEEEAKDAAKKKQRSWQRNSYGSSRRYVPSYPNGRVYSKSYSRSGKSYIPGPWRH